MKQLKQFTLFAALLLLGAWLAQPPIVYSQARVGGQVFLTRSTQVTTGNIFFVDSSGGVDDVGTNGSITAPFDSIDYAVGQCSANNGDVIYVNPLHIETVTAAGGLDLDVAGITVIGLGPENSRPQINFTTAVGADMDVDAADITMINFRFTGGIDALTGPLDINAARFSLHNSLWQDVTGQVVDAVVADANADGLTISSLIPGQYGWKHLGDSSAGTQSGIQIVGSSNVVIQDFWMDGNFAIGGIEGVTTAVVDITIGGGIMPWFVRTRNAADDIINIAVGSSSGAILGPGAARLNDNASSTVTECITTNGLTVIGDNIFVVNADDERGIVWDGTASAG
jgi:hypothetical protein